MIRPNRVGSYSLIREQHGNDLAIRDSGTTSFDAYSGDTLERLMVYVSSGFDSERGYTRFRLGKSGANALKSEEYMAVGAILSRTDYAESHLIEAHLNAGMFQANEDIRMMPFVGPVYGTIKTGSTATNYTEVDVPYFFGNVRLDQHILSASRTFVLKRSLAYDTILGSARQDFAAGVLFYNAASGAKYLSAYGDCEIRRWVRDERIHDPTRW